MGSADHVFCPDEVEWRQSGIPFSHDQIPDGSLEAVECADDLKVRNGLEEKMENVNAACEDVLPDILDRERKTSKKCVLVLDPPRQGVDEKLIEAIKSGLPDKIIYISCSPQTLARDVGLLTGSLKRNGEKLEKSSEGGLYELDLIRPYDMFPQTKHIETLVCLNKKII